MRKSLTKKQDPLIQFRVTDNEYEKLIKMADKETRTLPNLVKHFVLQNIK
ncbi:MAG: hypothetical protein ACC707_16340 [Thiohalomonadales bacterium]